MLKLNINYICHTDGARARAIVLNPGDRGSIPKAHTI